LYLFLGTSDYVGRISVETFYSDPGNVRQHGRFIKYIFIKTAEEMLDDLQDVMETLGAKVSSKRVERSKGV
jgi:hypothetical protein